MRKKVLIADDQNTVLMVERLMLKNAGYEVLSAKDGQEALNLALKERPDLILLDVTMPNMDGLTACRALRESPETRSTPIFLVTTRGETMNVSAGIAAGCNEYITKPFDAVDFINRVQQYLGH